MVAAVAKLAAFVGLLFVAGAVQARRRDDAPSSSGPTWLPVDELPDWMTPPRIAPPGDLDSWTWLASTEVAPMTRSMDPAQNVRAFLSAIAKAEGTDRELYPYRVCYGYRHTIQDFRDHPTITGEWKGEKLPDAMCTAAGFKPGCVSTAAGRYQITVGTWRELRADGVKLPDFSPESQDAAAVALLRKIGALVYVELGDLGNAVRLARRRWASLPGANVGQPEKSFAWIQDAYVKAGGSLA